MTPSERARHASLVRWGKEQPFAARLAAVRERRKAKKKAVAGKKPKAAKPTPEQRQAEKDRQAAANVASVGQALNDTDNPTLGKNGLDGLAQAAQGQEPGANVAQGLIDKGFAVRGEDGRFRLTADGKAVVRAAQSGDVNAVLDKLSEVNDKAVAKQKKEGEAAPAGGGGGGNSKKPTEDEKKQEKANERAKTATATAETVGLEAADLDALRAAAEGTQQARGVGSVSGSPLQKLGLVGTDGQATDQGRRALGALERGDVRQYRAALQDAAARMGREQATAARNEERATAQAERETERATRDKEREAAQQARDTQRAERERVRAERKRRQAERLARIAKRGGKLTNNQKDALIDAGLAEEDDTGFRLKEAAPAKKDIDMDVLETLTAIADQMATDADDAIKAGARHSASDTAMVQAVYDAACDICELAVALGASEEMDDDDGEMKQSTFGGKDRDDLDDSDFAGPGRTFPIMTAQDVKDAARLIGKADDPEAVKRKIMMIAKRKGLEDAIPEAWHAMKADDDQFVYGSEVKALDGDRVGALAVRFGSAAEPDMSSVRDYFTKATDYWLDAWDRRPMLYHHALDESTRDAPRIGTWTKATVTDEGVWLEGQLDRSHRYYGAIKELIKRGVLRVSSDSAPHLVLRERQANGTHEVKRWPLLAASLTPTPAEPRLSAVSLKALLAESGFEGIDTNDQEAQDVDDERADGLKIESERARRLLLQSRYIALQE